MCCRDKRLAKVAKQLLDKGEANLAQEVLSLEETRTADVREDFKNVDVSKLDKQDMIYGWQRIDNNAVRHLLNHESKLLASLEIISPGFTDRLENKDIGWSETSELLETVFSRMPR